MPGAEGCFVDIGWMDMNLVIPSTKIDFLRKLWLHVIHPVIHRYWELDICRDGDFVKASIINTNLQESSFFLTNRIGLAKGLELGRINPDFIKEATWFSIFSLLGMWVTIRSNIWWFGIW